MDCVMHLLCNINADLTLQSFASKYQVSVKMSLSCSLFKEKKKKTTSPLQRLSDVAKKDK